MASGNTVQCDVFDDEDMVVRLNSGLYPFVILLWALPISLVNKEAQIP